MVNGPTGADSKSASSAAACCVVSGVAADSVVGADAVVSGVAA